MSAAAGRHISALRSTDATPMPRFAAAGILALALVCAQAGGARARAAGPSSPRSQRAAAASAAAPPTAAGPDASARERYIDLFKRKERADRLNALWKLEGDLAAKRTAYAVLDLSDRKLYFKVRGRAFKAISFTTLDARRGSSSVTPEDLAWRAFTLELKEGKGVETESIQRKTLSPDEAKAAGMTDTENQSEPIGAEQGAVVSGPAPAGGGTEQAGGPEAPKKMAGVAGGVIPPDPPPKYHMGFDGGLSIWVIADGAASARSGRFDGAIALAKTVGRFFTPGGRSEETVITVHLPLNLGQQIFRQLLPGQRLLITL